jgi:hypothetical protein
MKVQLPLRLLPLKLDLLFRQLIELVCPLPLHQSNHLWHPQLRFELHWNHPVQPRQNPCPRLCFLLKLDRLCRL